MANYCANRLTVVGPVNDVAKFFARIHWGPRTGVLHVELMRNSPTRTVWQSDSAEPPLKLITKLSEQWPLLTFLLEYDQEDKRIKGLVKAIGGRIRHLLVLY